MRCLRRAGYLHRNVSPGNFLLNYNKEELPSLEDASKTKREDRATVVPDLEYSRPFLGGFEHDPITVRQLLVSRYSTRRMSDNIKQPDPYYTAVEVQCGTYQFKPRQKSFRDGPRSLALKCFAFNPYHDLESSLWMAFEFVIRRAPQKIIDSAVSFSGRSAKEILQEHAQKMLGVPEAGANLPRWEYLMNDDAMEALDTDLRLIYGKRHPVLGLVDCLLALREAYWTLEDSVDTPTVQLDNGHHAFDLALFNDAVYDTLQATYLAISDYYACAENAETFMRVPKPPGPVFYTFSGEAEGSDVDGSSEEYLGVETFEEGLPKDDRVEAHVENRGEVGGDMHVVNSGSVARDASETGADANGVASGQARKATPLKRKRDDGIRPEPLMQKAKRSRVNGAAPTRRSDRIRKMLAKKARREEVQVSVSRSK